MSEKEKQEFENNLAKDENGNFLKFYRICCEIV